MSLSGTLYETLVSWRNQAFNDKGELLASWEDSEPPAFRKIVAEIAFIPLILLSAIEGVVRGILCIVFVPLSLICGGKKGLESLNFLDFIAKATLVGAVESVAVTIGSGIGLIQNFRENKLINEVKKVVDNYLLCCCE
jgi:hypothetical protein